MRININDRDDKKIVIQPGELSSTVPQARPQGPSPEHSSPQVHSQPASAVASRATSPGKPGSEFLIAGAALGLVLLVLITGLVYFLNSSAYEEQDDGGNTGRTSATSPKPSTRGSSLPATQKYWSELGEAFNSLAAEGKETASQTSQRFREAARRVSGLAVMGVDEEAMEIGSSMIEFMGHTEVVFDGWQRLVDDSQALGTRVNSPEMMFESMVRGFLGDPMGVSNEVKLEKGKLDQRQQELLQQLEMVQRESNDLRAKVTRVRARLSARYGVEFPPLN